MHFNVEFSISKPIGIDPIALDLENINTVNNQICQFLKSTHELQLAEKAKQMKFETSKGKRKKKLSKENWDIVANKIGRTNLYNLLYRKRIKANYQDIDIFTYKRLRGNDILNYLIEIVNVLNTINELIIAKALGTNSYKSLHQLAVKGINHDFVKNRFNLILDRLQ